MAAKMMRTVVSVHHVVYFKSVRSFSIGKFRDVSNSEVRFITVGLVARLPVRPNRSGYADYDSATIITICAITLRRLVSAKKETP